MRVISRKALVKFWENNPGAKDALIRFYDIAADATWRNPIQMLASLPSADPVIVKSGKTVYVVNIIRNRFRLVMAVHFDKQRLFVLRVMTHAEYDLNRWKKEL